MCIYHANCTDGFTAAWVVRKFFGGNEAIDIEFHPGIYGVEPPDVTGKFVYLVDFSYRRDVIIEMAKKAEFITIIDHHKSAIADLNGIETERTNINVCFSIDRSGAGLTWRSFFGDKEPPKFLLHVEDRDLWKFELPGTREIMAYIFSHPYDFEVYDSFETADMEKVVIEGTAINRKLMKDVNELASMMVRRMTIDGIDVPAINANAFFSSEIGNILSKGEPFSVCYWDTPNNRTFSLRSAPDGMDVSEIAFKFGGGGHKHAAGFKVKLEDLNYKGEPILSIKKEESNG
jgi:oligoribonuclease NrnB/cAMP/cGMP phosphodiesterase (DHH superfamily)